MKKTIYAVACALIGAVSVSCDSNQEPTPWQSAEPSNAPGIFFANTDNIFSVTIGEDTHVSIPLQRIDTEGALTVPLVVETGHPALEVPSKVDFADGEQFADIVVDLANIPTKELISLKITFPDDYINPYVAGATAFEGSVIVSDWTPVSDEPVLLQWLDWSYNPSTLFDPVEQEILELPGTNRYRILNFLNSGIDFTFTIQPSEYETWVGYNRIIPLGNQVMYSEYSWSGYYNPWWLVEDDLQEWPVIELTSNSEPVTLYGTSFMWYDDEYQNEYCYMRLAGTTDVYGNVAARTSACMAFYAFYDETWDWANFTGYMFAYIQFPEK